MKHNNSRHKTARIPEGLLKKFFKLFSSEFNMYVQFFVKTREKLTSVVIKENFVQRTLKINI